MVSNEELITYAKAAKEAEASTSAIKDLELRKIAFDKILTRLLDGSPTQIKSGQKVAERRPNPKMAAKTERKSSGPKGWLQELVEEDFFNEPKNLASIIEELSSRSHHLKATDLTRPLEALCHEKKLRRKKIGIKKGDGTNGRSVLHWSNW